MPHNQQEHYIVMKATGQGTWTNRIEVMVKQFRYLEDLLLLWSIPSQVDRDTSTTGANTSTDNE